ncbi:DIS3-like exonuclease 2 isoform X1 [Brachionus plicatilis]|uniref:DIS3-like exonuclease 2 n=1 Tax=Brachionus plicatilis TaxID=10195 RepID=A0A3M7SE98_BRAPC|nr:DIS3-like exonuclease 2 isoform X1 [Brachionus plicatilis]
MENDIQAIDNSIIEVKTTSFVIEQKMSSIKLDNDQNFKQINSKTEIKDKTKPVKISIPPPNLVSLSQAPYKTSVRQNFRTTSNDKISNWNKTSKFSPKNFIDNEDKFAKQNFKRDKNSQTIESKMSPKKNQIKKSASAVSSVNSQQIVYDQYWDPGSIAEGLSNGTLLNGKLRINPRSYEDAFLTDPSGGSDIYINGLKDRNRALNNDVVAVKLKEKYSWKVVDVFKRKIVEVISHFQREANLNGSLDNLIKKNEETKNGRNQNEKKDLIDLAPLCFSRKELLDKIPNNWLQRTGFVVGIIEKKNNRWAVGHLKLFQDKNKEFALFSPNDSRIPRMKIKLDECPSDFYQNPQIYANTLFMAQILDIPSNSKYAIGELKRSIGQDGNIEAETEAILMENGIDYSEFTDEVIQSLPATPWSIPQEEFDYRKDLRNVCIFTIDPATARDLDDALHCVQLEDDLFEVGVHIADVSYFVNEDSPIDKCACERATSVYLVQKVIPMLPRLLCEQLCSLNPDTDRLTFSVIWKVRSNGDIVDEWFGKTVINSAVKLSYDHAQKVIENPEKNFDLAEFPPIRKEFNLTQIKTTILNLQSIAKALRQKRFKNGCLVLNQVKLNYVLNKDSGLPFGYSVYQQKDSNRLVEEFMLLANIAVAHHIYEQFPLKAILRRHPTPNLKQLTDLSETIKSNGFDCDVTSSNSIQAFLETIQQDSTLSSLTLTCLLTKTMQLAQYFCSGSNIPKEQFYHYGLAVPLYTHFTSPIRRYPDILVHRLLAASLGHCTETSRDPTFLQTIAENCNDKKYSARICSEKSSEMFFALFVNECGPLEEVACVIQIKDHSFDVLIVDLGISKRIYCDKLDIIEESINYVNSDSKQELSFKWKVTDKHREEAIQKLELFTPVNVVLTKHESDPLKFNITLKHPNEKPVSSKLSKEIVEQKEMIDYQNDHETTNVFVQRIDTDPYICD